MHCIVLLLPLAASASAAADPAAAVVSGVSPSTIFMELPTKISVRGSGFTDSGTPICCIRSLGSNFVGQNYSDRDYNKLW